MVVKSRNTAENTDDAKNKAQKISRKGKMAIAIMKIL